MTTATNGAQQQLAQVNKMMTRKDYVKTAEILNLWWNNNPVELSDFQELVYDFADWFADDNPNFNEEKFIEAVYGKKESVVK